MIGGEHKGFWVLVVKGREDTHGVLCRDGWQLRTLTQEKIFGHEVPHTHQDYPIWHQIYSELEGSNYAHVSRHGTPGRTFAVYSVEWVPITNRDS